MSAPTHKTTIELPNNEGQLRLIIESWETPSVEEVSARILQDNDRGELLIHACCSQRFVARTLSTKKRVMFCEKCGLRLEIPQQVTFGELSILFSQKPLSAFPK